MHVIYLCTDKDCSSVLFTAQDVALYFPSPWLVLLKKKKLKKKVLFMLHSDICNLSDMSEMATLWAILQQGKV